MRVFEEGGAHRVVCAACGYRSKPFDSAAKANGAAKNHATSVNHRRLVRRASLRRAA